MAHVLPTAILSGYNVDLDQLQRLLSGQADQDTILTPESVAAAYARISRRSEPLAELRAEAARDIARSRKSMESISHTMGHQSIAEHAFFNIDFNDVTRLVVELIQHHRLASYTERSQRYVRFQDDFLLPPEIEAMGLAEEFTELYRFMFATYSDVIAVLEPYFLNRHGDPEQLNKHRRTELVNLAKEDARYCIGLATQTSLGSGFNGREMELLIRRLMSHPSWEARRLGKMIKEQVQPTAPSLVKYCDPCEYFENLPNAVSRIAAQQGSIAKPSGEPPRVDYFLVSPNPDDMVIAAVLFAGNVGPMQTCLDAARKVDAAEKNRIYFEVLEGRQVHDNISRHFEMPHLVFGLTVSASLFAQLKRHRLSSQIVADYDPALGITVPPSLTANGLEGKLRAVAEKSEQLYTKILAAGGSAFTATYVLTNSHRRRVLMAMNLREMYHFAKERMADFAQWDIRITASEMAAMVREAAPITGKLVVGKDEYKAMRDKLLAALP